MLASFPASMLNQMPSDLGILNRFKLDPSRSRWLNRGTGKESRIEFAPFGVQVSQPDRANRARYHSCLGLVLCCVDRVTARSFSGGMSLHRSHCHAGIVAAAATNVLTTYLIVSRIGGSPVD
jgi:hypothetical protein